MDKNSSFVKQEQKYEIDNENNNNLDKSNKYIFYLHNSNSFFKYFSFRISYR